MELQAELKSKSGADIESWFLDALDQQPLPMDHLLQVLNFLAEGAEAERSLALADLLQETLAERMDRIGTLRLLALRSERQGESPDFRALCRQALQRVFKDHAGAALLAGAGFDDSFPVRECLRRLTLLNSLREGTLCHDKTWGFGVIRRMDDFYGKVAIDFSRKPGHQMTFAYAAETLELVSDDHLLARKHRDAAAMARMVTEDPAELVRIALRSYGPLNVVLLKEVLVPELMPEAGWKGFWDAARKQLRADPLAEVPANRNDPIRLLDRAKAYDAAWFAALAGERDPAAILAKAQELREELDGQPLEPAAAQALGERLGFAIRGVENRDPALAVRLVLAAKSFGFGGDLPVKPGASEPDDNAGARNATVNLDVALDRMLAEDRFLAASASMSARDAEKFIALLAAHDAARCAAVLLATLPRLSINAFGEAMAFLARGGRESDAAAVLTALVARRAAGHVPLLWLCRNLDVVGAWEGIPLADLAAQAMDAVGAQAAGENLRAQKQIKDLFQDKDWLELILDSFDHGRRVAFVTRLYASKAWPEAEKRSALAAMIKLCPDLARAIAGDSEAEESGPAIRFTSWRSYRERQAQLKIMVEKTLPENSREIATARSYGDLRENFEYQTAKDRQRLLLRRKRELEDDIDQVRGSDFEGLPADRAGMGTRVTVRRPDGRTERYCILGEWDRDEALGIIASRTKVAEALSGHAPGETVLLPGADGEEPCRIEQVESIGAEVRAWIQA